MSAWAPGAWAVGAWAGTAWQDAAPVEVPDVVGLAQADATTTLEGAGFVVAVTTATSSTVAAGLVISQAPAGGAFATEGSTVTIVVSTGDVTPVNPLLLGKKKKPNPNIKFKAAKEAKEPAPDETKPEPPKKRASGLLLGLLARVEPPATAPAVVVLEAPPAAVVVAEAPAPVVAPTIEPPPAAEPKPDPLIGEVGALKERISSLEATVVHLLAALEQRMVDIHQELSLVLPVESAVRAPEPVVRSPKLSTEELAAENLRRAKSLAARLLGGHLDDHV